MHSFYHILYQPKGSPPLGTTSLVQAVHYIKPNISINFIATGLRKESYSKGPAALGSYTNQEKANNIVQLVVVVAERKSNNLHNVFCTLGSF